MWKWSQTLACSHKSGNACSHQNLEKVWKDLSWEPSVRMWLCWPFNFRFLGSRSKRLIFVILSYKVCPDHPRKKYTAHYSIFNNIYSMFQYFCSLLNFCYAIFNIYDIFLPYLSFLYQFLFILLVLIILFLMVSFILFIDTIFTNLFLFYLLVSVSLIKRFTQTLGVTWHILTVNSKFLKSCLEALCLLMVGHTVGWLGGHFIEKSWMSVCGMVSFGLINFSREEFYNLLPKYVYLKANVLWIEQKQGDRSLSGQYIDC